MVASRRSSRFHTVTTPTVPPAAMRGTPAPVRKLMVVTALLRLVLGSPPALLLPTAVPRPDALWKVTTVSS
jgi:hypothetical protein